MKAVPPMNTFEFFHSQSMEIRALKNQKCSQMALFSYENLFFENYHIGGHLLGFQTKWIMTTQGTYYSTVITLPMVLTSSLDFHWPYCEIFCFVYMPSSSFILICTTIFWPGTNKINDFRDARSEQGLKRNGKNK